MVIARIWHGIVPKSKKKAYLDYVRRTGLKDYRQTPGNISASILVRDIGNRTEFVTISLWESMDAIKEFAGNDVEKARYYPEDAKYLLEFEPTVKHYEAVFFGDQWKKYSEATPMLLFPFTKRRKRADQKKGSRNAVRKGKTVCAGEKVPSFVFPEAKLHEAHPEVMPGHEANKRN